MVNSTIIIEAQNGNLVQNSKVYASSPTLSGESMNITMRITDTSDNMTDAVLNINPNSIRLLLYGTEEYSKRASLFFGNVFSGSFNSDIMWQLLGAATNEQINKTHLIDALSPIESDISDLADAFQIHYNNFNIHLTTEDRDFLTRLKALYGGVYNVALDYIVLKNPYEGEINITNQQIALFAGYGGFSAYSGALDIELEFYNLVPLTYPTKSGGEPTPEAFFAHDNTYGYGITTLTVPTTEPNDLTDGEVAIYAGEGGFKSYSGGNADTGVIVGYYYEGIFYLDDQYEQIAEQNPDIIYVDLLENKIYRYDEDESEFVQLTTDAELIEGYYVKSEDKFYATFDGTTYSDEIEGKDKTIYLDLETNVLYRYDGTEETFIPVSSASGNAAIIKGYKNSVDGKFYTDISYTEELVADAETLYYDILTSQIYYYIVSNQSFDRYHHKASIDYLLFNDNYAGTISPAQNQNALFVGSGGFTATSYAGNTEYFAGEGLYLNPSTYEFSVKLGFTSVNPNYHPVLADSQTGKLYVNVATSQGVTDHNQLTNRFSSEFSGNVVVQHDIDVISGLRSALNTINNSIEEIDRDTWSATFPVVLEKTYSNSNYHNIISLSTLDTVDSEESANTGYLLTNSSSYTDDYVTTNSEHHRKIDKRWVQYSNTILANRIVKRNNDSSIAASYLLLTEGQSSVSPYSGVAAVFVGSGGFTSTSYDGNNEYFAGVGLELDTSTYTFNVKLGYQTLGENYAVLQDADKKLYVRVPNTGVTDHNLLTHRFSTEYSGNVTYQHDIGVISGLQAALNKAESWGVTWPLVKQDNQNPQQGEFYHNLSLTPITKTTTADSSTSGYLLTSSTDYVENVVEQVNTRAWNKYTIPFNSAVANGSIPLRNATGGLAASYLLLTDSLSTTPSTSSGEVAVFSGSGGFTSTSYSGDGEYYADGVTTVLSNNIFSVKLSHTTSGSRYGIRAESGNSGGLYVDITKFYGTVLASGTQIVDGQTVSGLASLNGLHVFQGNIFLGGNTTINGNISSTSSGSSSQYSFLASYGSNYSVLQLNGSSTFYLESVNGVNKARLDLVGGSNDVTITRGSGNAESVVTSPDFKHAYKVSQLPASPQADVMYLVELNSQQS